MSSYPRLKMRADLIPTHEMEVCSENGNENEQ